MNITFPAGREGVYDHLIVHVLYTKPSMDVGAVWTDRVHRQKGWSQCGYHAVIRRDGTLEWELTGHPTRRIGQTGAHVGGCGPGWNRRSLGISLAGGMREDGRGPENNMTEAQFDTLAAFIRAANEQLGIPLENVMGHRDLIKLTNAEPKACPCFSVREWMDGWEQAGGLEAYDRVRSIFNWNRDERPPLGRGEKLRVPRTYTIRAGDTLWGISRTYGVRLQDIRRLNPGIEPLSLEVGHRIRLLN